MKFLKLLYVIILFIIPANLQAQVNDGDAFYAGTYDKELIAKNHIKKIDVKHKNNNEFFAQAHYFFDLDGNLVKILYADTMGKIKSESLFENNSKGGKIKIIENNFESGKTYETIYSKTYLENKLFSDSSGLTGSITYFTYDDVGRVIKTVEELRNYKLVTTYEYNRQGELLKLLETVIQPDGNSYLYRTTLYSYDKYGRKIFAESSGAANYFYTYYENGLLKSKVTIMGEEFNNRSMQEEYGYSFLE